MLFATPGHATLRLAALNFAHRARCAAAILRRAAAEIVRGVYRRPTLPLLLPLMLTLFKA
jgi:hypothetical protein